MSASFQPESLEVDWNGAPTANHPLADLQRRCPALARRIDAEIRPGVVVVRGEVASAYEKRLALHLIAQSAGERRIVDSLSIRTASPPPRTLWSERFRNVLVGVRSTHWGWLGLPLLAAGLLTACSGGEQGIPVYPVTGKVTVEGQPAAGAMIVLHPVNTSHSEDLRPLGQVTSDGSFSIGTYTNADGAPPGEYIATVTWQKLVDKGGGPTRGPNVVPARYGKPDTSDLRITVAERRNELAPIQIRK